jgi:chromosomal replication initiator protein
MPVKFDDIKKAVSLRFGVSIEALDGHSQPAIHTVPRQIVMYLARELTLLSLPNCGQRLGGRNHKTILHGARKVREKVASDPAFAAMIDDMKRGLTS